MSITITENTSRKELDKALQSASTKERGINLKKYFGKINFDNDGLAIQKRLRNEWK